MITQTKKARPGLERMSPAEWRRLGGMYGIIALLHILGWGTFFIFIAPAHYKALGIGTAVLAYTFGLRHAFDADHISAIDNTTRKLMADGKRPMGVGFFFSLGHSTVVVGLAIALSVAARRIAGSVSDDSSSLHSFGNLVGTLVSGGFLYLIGILNLVVLLGIIRVFREMRQGKYDDKALEKQLNDRGLLYRFFGPLARRIHDSWQMYPIGVLFGLGFDTATEVALLAITAGAAGSGLPFFVVLCLPILFTAGMSMMDTADGAFMAKAYGWAFSNPVRKVYYNIVITGLSVFVALIVGTIEIEGLLQGDFNWTGTFWVWMSNIDINTVGFIIVGMFVLTWGGALAIWKYGNIEQRWSQNLAPAVATAGLGAGASPEPQMLTGRPVDETPTKARRARPAGTSRTTNGAGGPAADAPATAAGDPARAEAKRREATRQASYAFVAGDCPVPIRRDRVALPAGLGYFDDEFVVAVNEEDEDDMLDSRIVLTTQRLIMSKSSGNRDVRVITLADVRGVGIKEPRFSDNAEITLETVAGHVRVPGIDDIISPDNLLRLVRYARTRDATALELHAKIAALVGLHEAGALSQDEFKATKESLLSRM